MVTREQEARYERFAIWSDTFEEEGVYPVSDNEIGIIERSWRWADRNPDRAKKRAEKKGESPKKA